MHSAHHASSQKQHRRHFSSIWSIGGFCAIVLLVLYIFYPGDDMITLLKNIREADPVTEKYLSNLIRTYPNNLEFRILLAQQELALGQINQLKKTLYSLPDNLPSHIALEKRWLEYEILRLKTYEYKPDTPERLAGEKAMIKEVNYFLDKPLTLHELKTLATDSEALGLSDLAVKYDNIIETRHPNQSEQWYVSASRRAIMVSNYYSSAKNYFNAANHAREIAQKRSYFLEGVKALEASGDAKVALKIADENIGGLYFDIPSLESMAQLALRANETAIADRYITRAMHLYKQQHDEANEN